MQFCSVSNTLSHTNVTNKVRGTYFAKEVFPRLFDYCVVMIMSIQHLGILEADTIKQVEMKEKNFKFSLRRIRIHEGKLHSRNLVKGINTWAVSLVRYSGPFLKWTREELKQKDQRTGKLMHKALHLRDDVDRLYVSRKMGG